jgi:hypothetical protein
MITFYLLAVSAQLQVIPGNYVLRPELAGMPPVNGAALVGYKQPGTGAASTTVYDKLAKTIHVTDFGAVCNSLTDDSGAFNAAVSAAPRGSRIVIPKTDANYCLLTSTVSDQGKNVIWEGSGPGNTEVRCKAIACFTVYASYTSFLNFSIKETSAPSSASTIGVNIIPSSTGFSNFPAEYQAKIMFDTMRIEGAGTDAGVGDVQGTGIRTVASIESMVVNSYISRWDKGIAFYHDGGYAPPTTYGVANNWVIAGSNIKYNRTGIYVDAGAVYSSELSVTGSSITANNVGLESRSIGVIDSSQSHYENICGANPTGVIVTLASFVQYADKMYENTTSGCNASGTPRNVKIQSGNTAAHSAFGTAYLTGAGIQHDGSGVFNVYGSPFLTSITGSGAPLVNAHSGARLFALTVKANTGATTVDMDGTAGQGSADILRFRDNGGTVLSAVSKDGYLGIRSPIRTYGLTVGTGGTYNDESGVWTVGGNPGFMLRDTQGTPQEWGFISGCGAPNNGKACIFNKNTGLNPLIFESGSNIIQFGVAANQVSGSGSALLGGNSPAVTNTAPYTWLKIKVADGSTAYIPAWK